MELQINDDYAQLVEYMIDVLGKEFPIRELTPEYLVMAMLDDTGSHSHAIIEYSLSNYMIQQLQDYYWNILTSLSEKQLSPKDMTGQFNEELLEITIRARECAKSEHAESVGSEHLLFAILDPKNKFSCCKKLTESGLATSLAKTKVANMNEDKEEKHTKNMDTPPATPNNKKKTRSSKTIENKKGTTRFISEYTIDLHTEIANGKYDSLVGRENVLREIIKVLSRRKKNNVILVGKPGVGKTSLGYKLADMIEKHDVPTALEGKKVLMLNTTALVAGTHLRGMFEERVEGLFKELSASSDYVLFIDDMQSVVKTSSKEKDGDLTDLITKILTNGDVRVIGAISFKDYRNGIESSPALSTKLQKIIVEPTNEEETYKILTTNKHYYEKFHHVVFDEKCLHKTIKLANRYITTNSLPDSALDILDLTGASLALENKAESEALNKLKQELDNVVNKESDAMCSGDFEEAGKLAKKKSSLEKKFSDCKKQYDNDATNWIPVKENDIAETVSAMTNIPVSKLTVAETTSILKIDSILKQSIIGQDEAINEISKAIKRAKAGFSDASKCLGCFLLIGSSGCGKTLLAKKLAENVYGDENALIRFDMSEYQDKSSVNKLIGSSAGYIGYDNGGLLTEAIKNKPYCVLLFDEIEKADESIYNLFLQLFDEGRLTDNNGTLVNFKNVIVIMTSNVGARQASELGNSMGFIDCGNDKKRGIMVKSLKNKFNPEFINRIDKIVYFNPLDDMTLKKIVKIELDKLVKRMEDNGTIISYDETVIDYIYTKALKEKEYGARPIMRLIQDNIADKIVDLVLSTHGTTNSYQVQINKDEIVEASIVV